MQRIHLAGAVPASTPTPTRRRGGRRAPRVVLVEIALPWRGEATADVSGEAI
jgi:hypothetical protein